MSRTAILNLPPATAAALAAHRFGLGEPTLQAVGSDPVGWLLAQIGPAQAQRGSDLATGVEGLKRYAQFVQRLQANRRTDGPPSAPMPTAMATDGMVNAAAAGNAAATPAELNLVEHFRTIVQNDVRARMATAATSTQPFNERLALFWANHFTVSMAKASARGIVGAFEREAIRPHIGGRFEQLLKASTHHAGMLRYLDNDRSAGPDSAVVTRRARRVGNARDDNPQAPRLTGLNENLAREVLELHTLGVAGGGSEFGGWGGYSQADVTAFAAVLTGWRVPMAELINAPDGTPTTRFDASWHQPGPKTVLGRRYAEGADALDAVLHDLAVHPSTARFVCSKLARHFVADQPPPALVARLVAAWQRSGGDLPTVYTALLESPEAWAPQPAKLKSPEEFVISTVRVLGLGDGAFNRVPDGGVNALGQRVQAAPSHAGWPDRAA